MFIINPSSVAPCSRIAEGAGTTGSTKWTTHDSATSGISAAFARW